MPSLRELALQKEPKKPKKDKKKPVKKAKKDKKKPKEEDEGIEITSDELRTAYFLTTKSSSRESLENTFKALKKFFNSHKIKEVGYRDYKIIEL